MLPGYDRSWRIVRPYQSAEEWPNDPILGDDEVRPIQL